ncbi:MAG: nitrile hydratase subunit beta [Gammaproteobacteria bacterium]
MRAAHDLGGLQGLGPIAPEPEQSEPVFHAEWEKRMFALTLACGFLGQWNLDESRHARERQRSEDYLKNSYYENWWVGLRRLLIEKGLVSEGELNSARPEPHAKPSALSPLMAERVAAILAKGGPVTMPVDRLPGFAVGDRVRVKSNAPAGHTRIPGYIRGRIGKVVEHHGSHVFPDTSAKGQRTGEHLFSVAFSSEAVWGGSAPGGNFVLRLDMWEPYLDRVS